MKIAIFLTALLGLLLSATACSGTAKGVQRDAHNDAKWVGHRF